MNNAANIAILTQPFKLEVTSLGTQPNTVDRFRRYHGPDLLAELLEQAGLAQGAWTFRISAAVKASGRTPPIQVRRVESAGVHLWLKPGSNDSGVKGTLLVTKDKELSNEEVYRRLTETVDRQAVLDRKRAQPETVPHVELFVDDDDARLLLTAVHEARTLACPDVPAFVRVIAEKMSSEAADPSYWLEALEVLVDRGWLVDKKTHYQVTPPGFAFLEGGPGPAAANGAAPMPAEPTPPPPVAKLLVAHKDKLAHLVALANSLAKLHAHREQIAKDTLQAELRLAELKRAAAEDEEQERRLTQDVDADALRCLLNVED